MMSTHTAKAVALVGLACLAACSSPSNASAPERTAPTSAPTITKTQIIPTSAGVIAGTAPTGENRIWVLAGTRSVKTLSRIDLNSDGHATVVPVRASANSVAASVTGVLAVGLQTGATGEVEFHNGATGAPVSTTPLRAPVIDIAAGADGHTFYALTTSRAPKQIVVIESLTGKVVTSLPVAAKAIAVTPSADQQSLYLLTAAGRIEEISASSGRVASEFDVPIRGIDLALSASGTSMYVLGGPPQTRSISVVDLATEAQVSSLAAAAHAVSVAAGSDSSEVFDFVGTPTVGNVQLIKLAGA